MKFQFTLLPLVAASALALTGCDDRPASQVCAGSDGRRVDDWNCSNGGHGGGGAMAYHWYYMRNGSYAGQVGAPVMGGSYAAEPGMHYSTVSRGGFGSMARAFGGFGE